MAVLIDTDRVEIWSRLMRDMLQIAFGTCSIIKADLRAAIDATDSWQDTNAAAFNTALPLAARNGLTATQKTLLFCYVALKRAGR